MKRTSFMVCAMLMAMSLKASAATLIEKEKTGQDLTATELTAIFLAEIKDCQDKVPSFSDEARPLLTQFKNSMRYRKISGTGELDKTTLQSEAAQYVSEHRRNVDVTNQCKSTLQNLREQVKLIEHQ